MPVEIRDLGRAKNFCQSSSARPSFSRRSLRTERRSGLVAAITHYTELIRIRCVKNWLKIGWKLDIPGGIEGSCVASLWVHCL